MRANSDDVDGLGGSHCTLCALGIPDHVESSATTGTTCYAGAESSDPVTIYLQQRRLGSKTGHGPSAT